MCPNSLARDVPMAWAAVPKLIPRAIGLFTRPTCRIRTPNIAPKSPTHITMAAVSDGMPPSCPVTSIAIGVVTDFGAKDIITESEAPIHFATNTTDTTPTTQPASCDMIIGINCLRIVVS